MLVLGRRLEESIMIGHDIEVKVLRISNNHVQLGIRAPKSISVYRQEIHHQVEEENRKAIASSADAREQHDYGEYFQSIRSALKKTDINTSTQENKSSKT